MSKRKSDFEHGPAAGSKKASVGFWKDGLRRASQDPALLVKSNQIIVIIRDKFPKVINDSFLILQCFDSNIFLQVIFAS